MTSTRTTERSSLLHNDRQPRYAFETGVFKERTRRLRHFQLCICSILTIFFVIGFVAAVAYTIHSKYTDGKNSTVSSLNNSDMLADESLSVILSTKWPLPDEIQIESNRSKILSEEDEDAEWNVAFIIARENMVAKDNLEKHTPTLDIDTPSYRHQKVTATTEKGREYARLGHIQEYALKYVTNVWIGREAPVLGHHVLQTPTPYTFFNRAASKKLLTKENVLTKKNFIPIRIQMTTSKDREVFSGDVEQAFRNKNRNQNVSSLEIPSSSCFSSMILDSDTDIVPTVLRFCGKCSTKGNEKMVNVCNKEQELKTPFRRYDGRCNNLKFPETFGVAYRPFRRALPPDYAGGISTPRMSKTGDPLPSARTVSLVVHRPYYKDDPKFTVMLAVWGQFLDHDMTATALSLGANGSSISCCQDFESMHPECFPVILDPLDPYFRNNQTCMEFVRSAPAPRCFPGPRNQLNQVTAFIDGSVIYGPDQETAHNLRTLQNGLLKMYLTEDNRTLLPISNDETDGCNRKEQNKNGRYCFMAGDKRSNENLHLTSMHLIWARQHNLLAENLLKINPHWHDERIFQEARRIIAAQMQHITYNEFLPILFGPKIMQKFTLKPLKEGYYDGYDENTDPTIANSFASAAFRFAHTIIPGFMKFLANETSSPEYVQLHKMLFDPFELYRPGQLDRTLKGAMQTSIEASDTYFTNELKQHLFERRTPNEKETNNAKACGLDLVSLNIQRGRDHGLPGYTKWRKHCNLTVPETFEDLIQYIDGDSLLNIRAIYNSVEDIDLYTGALSEKPLEGGIIGATVTCLVLDQFLRAKNGDRFWYENQDQHHGFGFKYMQLQELRQTTLARIICDNSDDVRFIQRRVMERTKERNKNVPCSDIPKINLIYWKEEEEVLPRVHISGDEMDIKTISVPLS